MSNRRLILAVGLVGLVALTTNSATNAAVNLTRFNRLTFHNSVSLPGVVLPPGTYMFESGPIGTHRDIVRVSDWYNQRIFFTGFTRVVYRPAGMKPGEVVLFDETPGVGPMQIRAWYPMGSKTGHEFRPR